MQSYWDDEKVYSDGNVYFKDMIKDIDQARELITVEMYLFLFDSLGEKIAHHLVAAHARGVKIQILVDGVGSHDFFDKLHTLFSSVGIPVKMYNPLPFLHPYHGKMNFRRRLEMILLRFWRMNRRDHRKIVTIDNKIMYTGSYNFTAEHTNLAKDKTWKDMGVRVVGANVTFAVLQFKKIWKLREYYKYSKEKRLILGKSWQQSPLRLNSTLFMRRFYYRDLLLRIRKSQRRIWLMTPYFIPKRRVIRFLAKAARRGVDVRILISKKSDVRIFQTLQSFYYPYLLKKGVRIFEYADTILHAKNFIIDDWMTVGSSNLNHRSILHDLEVDLAIQESANCKMIEKDFIDSTHKQVEITLESLKQRSLIDKFLSRVFFTFKYWF